MKTNYIVLRCPDPRCSKVHAIPEDDFNTYLYASLQVMMLRLPSLEGEYETPEQAKDAFLFFEANKQAFQK